MTIIETIKFYNNITSIPANFLTVEIAQANMLQLNVESNDASTFKIGVYGQTVNDETFTSIQAENISTGEKNNYIETIGTYKFNLTNFLKFYVKIEEINSSGLTCQGQLIISDEFTKETSQMLIGKKGNTETSEIFNDYENNKAIGPYSQASGYNTTAGTTGYYFVRLEVDETNTYGTFYLNPTQSNLELTLNEIANLPKDFAINYAVNDIVSYVSGSKYLDIGKITNIDTQNMSVTVEATVKGTLKKGAYDNGVDDQIFYVYAKPTVGIANFGHYAVAEGEKSIAIERSSHAEGRQTVARGQYGHAEGRQTEAGYASHAEGQNSKATGSTAHAEGFGTKAVGGSSHSEGYKSEALGDYAHAEGNTTKAEGVSSHSEGHQTKATAAQAHSEGRYTQATAISAHAEGYNSVATNENAHAEGRNTQANGINSHAEGSYTIASLENAHAEGYQTKAEAKNSHTEGAGSKATGEDSHAEGSYTLAQGEGSHAEGKGNLSNIDIGALGNYSHSEGLYTSAKGESSHAEGTNTIAEGNNAHSEGNHSNAIGESAHAEGGYTTAEGNNSHSEGYLTKTFVENAHAEGSHSEAKGVASHAEGYGSKALGEASHAEGYVTTASGKFAHSEGFMTVAEGDYSHSQGWQTKARSAYQTVEGKYNVQDSKGKYVHIVGNGSGDNTGETGPYESNAYTLDWEGNGWFGGSVEVSKQTTDEDNDLTLVTKGYLKKNIVVTPEVLNVVVTIGEEGAVSIDKTYDEILTAYRLTQDILFTINNNPPSMQYSINEISRKIVISTIESIYWLTCSTDNIWTSEQTNIVTEANNVVFKGDKDKSLRLHVTANATQLNSIAAGTSTASNAYTFASGYNSEASGAYTFVHGREVKATKPYGIVFGRGTVSSSQDQFVLGKYNVADANKQYLVIVGNGEKEDVTDANGNVTTQNRSNAYTLGIDGTGSFAGKVKVGVQTTDNDDDLTVVTKGYMKEITETYATKDELENLTKEILNVVVTVGEEGAVSVDKTFEEILTAHNAKQEISFALAEGLSSTQYLINETSRTIVISTIEAIHTLTCSTDNIWTLGQTGVVTEANNLVYKGDNTHALRLQALATATGMYSIASGSSTSSGPYTFSGGTKSESTSMISFAFGSRVKASGQQSVAFGNQSEASGTRAVAFGLQTRANSANQIVSGKYNIADTNGEYLIIVGNGEKEDVTDAEGNITTQNRSNAYTLSTGGTGFFAEKVKVGQATTDEDDDLVLVSKGYLKECIEYLKDYMASSMSTLLNITPDDEGKVLKVINGSPAWVDSEYQNAEEVTF